MKSLIDLSNRTINIPDNPTCLLCDIDLLSLADRFVFTVWEDGLLCWNCTSIRVQYFHALRDEDLEKAKLLEKYKMRN
jgi:hypothetical protein